MAKLKCLFQEMGTPIGSVIWMHGLGANAYDFYDFPYLLKLPVPLRFIFPNAPIRPVTLNGGMPMPSWYDILSLDENPRSVNAAQLEEINTQIHDLILEEENKGITSENVMLVGFSQGGSLALYSALTYPKKLKGVLGLSTYLPVSDVQRYAAPVQKQILITLFHGEYDEVVSLELSKKSAGILRSSGYNVSFSTYPVAHQVSQKEIEDVASLLTRLYA